MSQLRECTGCERQLPLTDFWRDKNTPDGIARRCKDCARAAKIRYQADNPPQYEGGPKQCTSCKKLKLRTEFSCNRRTPDGLAYQCKECASNRGKNNPPQYEGGPKWCSGCKAWKPRVEFGPCRTNLDGLQYWCKSCLREYDRRIKYIPGTEYDGDKKCSLCKRTLPRTEFHHNQCAKDGLSAWCKDCSLEHKRQQRQIDHPPQYDGDVKRCPQCEQILPRTEFYRDKTIPGGLSCWCKDCKRGRIAKYRRENPEKSRETNKRWRESHADELAARKQIRSTCSRSEGSFTVEQWENLCAEYDHRCLCCGERKPLTVDHIVPISKGGSSRIENIQPLCLSCNSRKYVQVIDYRPTSSESQPQPGCAP